MLESQGNNKAPLYNIGLIFIICSSLDALLTVMRTFVLYRGSRESAEDELPTSIAATRRD